MGIFRKSENEKKLDTAKTDLAAAKAKLVTIDGRKNDALGSGAAFAAWREEQGEVASEADRLEGLTAALIAGGEAQAKFEAEELLKKRVEAARKNNAAIAERLRTEGAKLTAALKELARDVARSQVETAAVNRLLPAGMPHLADANNIGRGRAAIPRENISEKTIDLWCRATDGGLLGDQDAIVPVDSQTGHLFVNNMRVDCVRREFRSVQYHPEIWSEIPENFHSTLRLPNFDRQGVDFDGQRMVEEHVAALNLDAPKAETKSRRPAQTELIPLEAWAPPVLKPVGSL